MLEIKSLSAGYGKRTVLHNTSACFEKGKLLSVIGPNGSGKSTLLRSVAGILPPISGEILLDGKSLYDIKKHELAKKLSYLCQGKAVPDMTTEQLVLHGRFPHLGYPRRYTKKDREIAFSVMEQLKISDVADHKLSTLSGGMIQTAYIAMALCQNTDYILLDEPTTYLDVAHQTELMKILRQLADNGKGIVSVMHDLPLAFTFSDRIFVLDKGIVIADGTPEEICKSQIIPDVFGINMQRSDTGDYFCVLRK